MAKNYRTRATGVQTNMQAMRLRTPKGARQEVLPMVQARSGIGG